MSNYLIVIKETDQQGCIISRTEIEREANSRSDLLSELKHEFPVDRFSVQVWAA